MEILLEERKESSKEIYCGGILVGTIERMHSYCAAADGIVAASAATGSHQTNRASTQRDAANCHPTDSDQKSNSAAAEREQANGESAGRKDASRQAAASKPPSRDIAGRKDGARMTAPFAALKVWSNRNRPKWQPEDFAGGLAAHAFAGELLAGEKNAFGFAKFFGGQFALRMERGQPFKFVGDVHGITNLVNALALGVPPSGGFDIRRIHLI